MTADGGHRSVCVIESIGRSVSPLMPDATVVPAPRQSTPSISSGTCAEVNDSVSPRKVCGGEMDAYWQLDADRDFPCSRQAASLLASEKFPVPIWAHRAAALRISEDSQVLLAESVCKGRPSNAPCSL